MARILSLLMLVPLITGCITFRTVDDGLVRARIGETARAGPLAIVPERVIEDSRCPAKVQCIQAGTVRLAVRINGQAAELDLGKPAGMAGGTVTLAEANPAARAGSRLYPDEYRFGFRWDRD